MFKMLHTHTKLATSAGHFDHFFLNSQTEFVPPHSCT
jgi:hypothetical protein